jgi:hypothetical protein
MNGASEYRIGGCIIALLIGLGVPSFLLGPFLFNNVEIEFASTFALIASAICALFGLWLLVVSFFAEDAVVEKVVTPFQGSEAVFLFLPYMLFIGTASIWRRITNKRGE